MRLDLTTWHRDRFAIVLFPHPANAKLRDRAELVHGVVSGPFGIYRGTSYTTESYDSRTRYTLVHLPTQVPHFTLPRQSLCRQAAQELGECDLAWEAAWLPGVVGAPPEMEKALAIFRRWHSWGRQP